jgi:hypothetical protein
VVAGVPPRPQSSPSWQAQAQSEQQSTCTPTSQGVADMVGAEVTGVLLVVVVQRRRDDDAVWVTLRGAETPTVTVR